jgi:hypothetical protein
MSGLVAVTVFAIGGVFGVPAAVSSPDYPSISSAVQTNQPHQYVDVDLLAQASAQVATTTTTASTTTTTAPAPTTTTTTAAPAPAPTPAPAPAPAPTPAPVVLASSSAAPAAPPVPAIGDATVWGCAAALAYLQTYAAPGFALDCPGYAEGHEAMTCVYDTPAYPDACPNGPTIDISDACPQAYMNESANSWNLTGQLSTEQQKFGVSYSEIDPFGPCP